ncbi:hypothetical protein [Methanococcus aeolicus]|uniref:hypothetical protein n=1 Tax=Methanococcus aeolicus TaxID=42879 RepID=UPI0021C74AA4|nr:hypothetical protein [Methanococcus aeolicus]UXM84785.1 hypothetical protein N6C89_00350 [Methanococcus aeolicus]
MDNGLKHIFGLVISMIFGFFIFAYISNNNPNLSAFGAIVGILAYFILYLISMIKKGKLREKFGEFYNPYEVYVPHIYGIIMGILYVFSGSSETMQFIFSTIVCMTILISITPMLIENHNEKIDELKMEILKNSGYSAFKSIMIFLATITLYSISVKYIAPYGGIIISGNSIGLLMMYAIATYYMYYAYYIKKYS